MARILLIDDDVDLIEGYQLVLSHRGHEVQAAYSADEARRVLRSGTPDVVVLDVMMESQTAGFELAREIHALCPALPILMTSGVHQAAGVPFRFEPDADWLPVAKFLDKPVLPDALAEEIERTVGKK
ncbi:MAG: response regulator [Phycisphaerae bacterium]|nr:response regulator [Phycisphaerae bacterium]